MDSDKIRKKAPTLIALLFFIAGIGLILGLSGWWAFKMAIIITMIIIVVWLKPLLISQSNQLQQQSYVQKIAAKIFGAGGSGIKIAIAGIIILAGYLIIFSAPDEIYTAKNVAEFSNGGTAKLGKNDFSAIEIYFAEMPKKGDIIDISIGSYKARIKVGNCYYFQNKMCYLGEWWYIDNPNNPIGANSGGVAEVWYVSGVIAAPLKIKNGLLQSPAIWIGDKYIISLLRNDVLTPKPFEGEKTISCGGCKIEEVRINYNLLTKLEKLIGWI